MNRMAGLIKELLLDASLNRISVDLRSDLIISIQSAFASKVLNSKDIKILDYYLEGYTADEIAAIYTTTTSDIEEILARIFTTIEGHSGYTDDGFIRKIETSKKYRKSGIRALRLFLQQHGKEYRKHGIEE